MNKSKTDYEWVKLVLEAKKLGFSIEEIRAFLNGVR
ncbi:anti-repressor SinI family protein [Virgibacillus byunsanensis]|uniref:Anti-repressor SinI family protein n=1 Tax=Virgibacillus byunsanensis TaxID=570945 RepID=A0ABW3LR45_9BACI